MSLELDRLRELPRERRAKILARCSTEELSALFYHWEFWARPDQLPPKGRWSTWFLSCGVGAGKTRTGAEFIRRRVERGKLRRGLIVGRTEDEVRKLMIEGEAGIMAVCPPWNRPHFKPSEMKLEWRHGPGKGAVVYGASADVPDSIRGETVDTVWSDEIAAWKRKVQRQTYDVIVQRLRLGDPRHLITSSPRAQPLLREIRDDPTTRFVKLPTHVNAANLPAQYLANLEKRKGTAWYRQEVLGEILDDEVGVLFRSEWFRRVARIDLEKMLRIVVAVDPAISTEKYSDETGIIVAAIDEGGNVYFLDDLSGRYSPDQWADLVVDAYDTWGADMIVAEKNRGGDLVEATIRAALRDGERDEDGVVIKTVRATRGKGVRAEPLALLYEAERVFHVGDSAKWTTLERQLVDFDPLDTTASPDRLDAAVWAVYAIATGPDVAGSYANLGKGVVQLEQRELPSAIGEVRRPHREDPTPEEWMAEQEELAQGWSQGGGGHRFL